MKVFHSTQYSVIGFENGLDSRYRGWVLQQKVSSKDFVPQTVIISEAKFIDGDKVIFLQRDGQAIWKRIAIQYEYLME